MDEGARDDVQFQILEHLRALRADVRAIDARLDRIEARQAIVPTGSLATDRDTVGGANGPHAAFSQTMPPSRR